MQNHALQLTLRDMRILLTSSRTLVCMTVAALMLGISGPFHTFESLMIGPRFVYWAILSSLCFVGGTFFGTLIAHASGGWPSFTTSPFMPLRFLLIGCAAGLPVTLIVSGINFLSFGPSQYSFTETLNLAAYCISISIGISVLFALFSKKNSAPQSSSTIALVKRLPMHLRAPLVSLSVQDHYVNITTTKGTHLHLMRLSDAIDETGEIDGLQIHRSHWVALAHIRSVKRQNGRVELETNTGTILPVSRTYLPQLKEKGLLS